MKKQASLFLLLILFLSASLLWQQTIRQKPDSIPISPQRPMQEQILLVPLDGRPPCRQFVIDAGRISGTEIITPPGALQDYYSQPGDTAGMRSWLSEHIDGSSAALLSIDQLLYGGLLAAREKELPPSAIEELLQFLRQLHAKHPDIPLYAFSILPRQTPQDTIDGYQERRDLLAYSRLKGREDAGLAINPSELSRLEQSIPADSLQRYLSHFTENEALNRALIELVREGVLTRLILGQDDGEPYSIPNIEKRHLLDWIRSRNLTDGSVILTHGADEIALSLLTSIHNEKTGFHPRIHVRYNHDRTPTRIMPYMAVSVEQTVQEKIALLGGQQADSEEDADFTLLVSSCDSKEDDLSTRRDTVQELERERSLSMPVALVDLSRHFQAQETVLPLLIQMNYPVNELIAYAGWNTTSNAIGTALAQASLFESSRRQSGDRAEAVAVTAANLTFLQNRILEDYFYLKDTIDLINTALQKAGYTNTADLDLEHNYRWANLMLQHTMKNQLAVYKNTRSFRQPVRFSSPSGDFELIMQDITIELSYPWPRTFEIHLRSSPLLAITRNWKAE